MKMTEKEAEKFASIADSTIKHLRITLADLLRIHDGRDLMVVAMAMLSASSRFAGNVLCITEDEDIRDMMSQCIEAEINRGVDEYESHYSDLRDAIEDIDEKLYTTISAPDTIQ